MDSQYLELFKQLIRLKTTHDAENRPEHDRCRELLKAEAEKRGLKDEVDIFRSLPISSGGT